MKAYQRGSIPGVYLKELIAAVAIAWFVFGTISCRVTATTGDFYGSTIPPKQNILRYVNGDEARIYMALYQGLIDYDPRTLQAIPALAERWEINNDSSEFVFHLRHNAVWSNRDPITAHDFVYSVRRGVSPALASQNSYLAFYINYAEAYFRKAVFAKDSKTNQFVLEKDVADTAPAAGSAANESTTTDIGSEYESGVVGPESLQGPDVKATGGPDTAFHQLMHSPARLTLPGDEAARNELLAKTPKLQAVLAGDDYTVRISLSQPAPYFLGLLGHQLFRLAPRSIVEKYGDQWTQPEHIVTCGPFKMKAWIPYSELVVERDPLYWDAANVHLDEIHFFVSQDNPTSLNLYKVGEADAVLNHAVPNAWLQVIRPKKDYMDGAEASIAFININVTKPPMNDIRVRRAFNMAIDKVSYATSRLVTKPLTAFTPEGIFVGYPQPKGDSFDPEQARKLLGEAGFPVTKQGNGFQCKGFPVGEVEYIFNTNSSNRAMAEYMQAQWKQNLGITVPLRSMEFKTFLPLRNKLEFKGFAVGLWSADYMDPFTFLGLFSTPDGSNGSGWFDPKYVAMLNEANLTLNPQKRYELLAKAEKYMLDNQPVIPIETFAVNWLKKPYVKGMYPNAASLYPWKFVYIERDSSKWDYGVPSLSDK